MFYVNDIMLNLTYYVAGIVLTLVHWKTKNFKVKLCSQNWSCRCLKMNKVAQKIALAKSNIDLFVLHVFIVFNISTVRKKIQYETKVNTMQIVKYHSL